MTEYERLEKEYRKWLETEIDLSELLTLEEKAAVFALFDELKNDYELYIDKLQKSKTYDEQQSILQEAEQDLTLLNPTITDILSGYANIVCVWSKASSGAWNLFTVEDCLPVYYEAFKFTEQVKVGMGEKFLNSSPIKNLRSALYKLRMSTDDDVNENIPKLDKEVKEYVENAIGDILREGDVANA